DSGTEKEQHLEEYQKNLLRLNKIANRAELLRVEGGTKKQKKRPETQ
ncbi:MAG: hypothetical protein HQ538_06185, partial [Parcubacteria group bacterium]|nr:hypothetical protein [Parcubacteria group bacterium]